MGTSFHTNTVIFSDCAISCQSANRKVDWLKEVNWAYHGSCDGGLMCSFTDKDLSEFIQAKMRVHGVLNTKHAIATVGKQANGYWVLNDELVDE